MKAYIIDSIDLEKLCVGWKDKERSYELEDLFFEEFVNINKETRAIINYGYMGLLSEWNRSGIIYFK